MGWEYTDFQREELYEQVWTEPVTKVAKRYAISDVGLRKICLDLEVPLPPVGYWAKLAAGRAVKRPPLGTAKGPTTYRRSRYVAPLDGEFDARYRESLEEDSPHRPAIPNLPLRTSLEDCLPLAKRVAKKLEGKGRDAPEWRQCDGAGLMSVDASNANRLRAVLLLNLALESVMAAGYAISADAKGATRAFVSVLDLNLSFKIRERNRREPIPLTREQRQKNEQVGFNFYTQRYEFHPTGEFDIAVTEPDSGHELAKIGDGRTASVETKIVAFIGRLRELSIRRRVKAEIDTKRKVIAEAKAAEERRLAEIRRKALERLKQVEELASKLERANRLRSLADKFQTEKLSSNDGVVDADWIRRAADWLDPTVLRRWDEADGPSDGAAG
ncbi:hypothetical protein A6V36_20480 [Paraburkholderia ginsengiterrae]|uniref:Uncharacterized protein n=1 Tax=Paraburkholderia ginsengiterrae TaxID=1462993 RepID=A0A1A9NCH5_9BURK|nr:hypothetical protein [Paraburkholderia ginsengiterrae]OAJ62751.1 hypothetical protein A6V36_20480 [Paraburkholderia ginsengiterrae]OAJ64411.1 hypothetical protein A6V37_19500 [Paraburkholderia ginsengiterrae]